MRPRYSASSVLVLLSFLTVRAAAQTPAPAPPAIEPTAPAPATATEATAPATEPPAAPPSTEPVVEPAPAVPPGTGQPPPPPPPAESTKASAAPSPGMVTSKWNMTLYGFAEVDLMRDSTQSFSDSPGNNLIVRSDALTYRNSRIQTTARNSRLGLRLSAPEYNGMRATGNIELDFMGNQPAVSEASFVNNGTFRIRAAYARIESKYVDVLAGQSYFLFGQQPFFFPMSIWFFGLPGQVFGRTQQFRVSRLFKTDAVNVDVGASVQRPPQRDSGVPDFHGALKVSLNRWKGLHTIGSGYAAVDPITVGVSGVVRQFRVNEFSATPMRTNKINGWGISVDGMLPIIPAASTKQKAHALTATGSFANGKGIGDLLGGLTGGATFPALPPPAEGQPAPAFVANIDNGMVQYDSNGRLRTIDWRTMMVGAQYYLPPNGEVTLGANYTRGTSDNIADGLSGPALTRVMKESQFFEATLLGDITPAVRAGAAWQHIRQTLGDDMKTKNNRFALSVYFFF